MTRTRLLALPLALALVVAACSDSSGEPTTSVAPPVWNGPRQSTTMPEIPTFSDDELTVGTDEAVRMGTLDNGLTYFIRENDSPGGRAQLRLAVNAGSVQETDEQRGVAHYLEHMMFNGTSRFPAQDLVLLLQRFGAEFGPDINAYTSYEETVYELELPTDDADTLSAGFDVLLEWATAVALDPEEVELERGVLVEEWRLRDQNFWGRYFEGVTEILLAETIYDDRSPLGTPEQVAATTVAGLRDFVDRWYRTDTMAIVAVGDFDADVIEQMIFERFDPVEPPLDPEPIPQPVTEPATEPAFFIIADPEYPQAWAELNYPLPAPEGSDTVGGVRQAMALDLAWTMIVNRLQEASLRGEAPFFDPSFASNPLVRAQRSPGLAAFADPADLGEATEALLAAVARASQRGFSDIELDRAVDEIRGDVELAFDERGTTQDAEYADRYVERFLGGGSIPSAEEWHELQLRLLDEMTTDQVWATFGATVASTEPFVILVAPESASGGLPTEPDLRAIVDRVSATEYDGPPADPAPLEALMDPPPAADITSRGQFSDTGLTEITLANGARVVFLPTNIREDVVVFRASSPGGWAGLPASDVAEAQFAADIAINSGAGDIDQVTLDRTLAGLVVSLTPFIDEVHEGFFGEAATRDLETLLQLVHLYMTQPRFEETARGIVVSETLPYAANPQQLPDLAVEVALADVRFAGDPRFQVIPTAEDLTTLDLQRAGEIFRDAFDDPGDFVFVFAGDFDEASLEELTRRYLGSMPGPGTGDVFENVRPDPPSGVVERIVEAGTGQLGGVTLLFSTLTPIDDTKRIEIDLLELVLQQRLTERIREELSASYSPFAYAELVEDPEQTVELRIQISGDPAGLDEVVEQTLAELTDLRTAGPTTDELAIAQEQLRREYELVSNELLSGAVIFAAEHPGQSLSQVVDRVDQTNDPTRSDIRDLANELLPADRYIVIRLVPEGFAQ
jgi:zinc protease